MPLFILSRLSCNLSTQIHYWASEYIWPDIKRVCYMASGLSYEIIINYCFIHTDSEWCFEGIMHVLALWGMACIKKGFWFVCLSISSFQIGTQDYLRDSIKRTLRYCRSWLLQCVFFGFEHLTQTKFSA